MTEKLKAYLDSLFASVPATKEVQEAKDELYDGMVERYEECRRAGMDEQAAYDQVVDSIGDIRELIDELDTGAAQSAAGQGRGQVDDDGPYDKSGQTGSGGSGWSVAGFDLGEFVGSITEFAGGLMSGIFSGGDSHGGEQPLANSVIVPLAGVHSIEISYISEAVTVRRTPGDAMVVNEYLSKNDPAVFAQVRTSNGAVEVKHGQRIGLFLVTGRVEILLPQSFAGSLHVGTVSGKVRFEDEWTFSSLSAKTVSGRIEAQQLAAGMLRLASTSGSVMAQRLEGTMELSSISGSVLVEDARGGGNFSTTSGNVRVYFTQLSANVRASSISGGVRLGIPQDTSFELDAKSTSGSIHTAFDDALHYVRRSRAYGTVGIAPYINISLSTTSGGIHLND